MKDWGRVITAMPTPMDKDGLVDYKKAVECAGYLAANGTTALCVSGTTGESPTLTLEEKERLFKEIKQGCSLPMIAGVGTNATAATIENAERAQKCGADGLLAVVPYYNKPNQESIYAHFEALNKEVSVPVMLYNVPGRTGCNMAAETAVALSKLSHIAALKEASGDLVQLGTVVRDCKEGFSVYTGEDAQILPTMAVGGYGVVSVAASVVGLEISNMIQLYLEGDVKEAGEQHRKLIGIFGKLFMTSNPVPLKAAMRLMGMDMGDPRLPLLPASDAVVQALRAELMELGKL